MKPVQIISCVVGLFVGWCLGQVVSAYILESVRKHNHIMYVEGKQTVNIDGSHNDIQMEYREDGSVTVKVK